MNYVVIGSLRSPFVRMTRMFLLANNIPFTFKVIDYLENTEDAKYLAEQSPINRIPILIDQQQKIFDSRVIYYYLLQKHKLLPLTIEEDNYVSVITSAMDTTVNLFLFKRGGLDIDSSNWYMKRQKDRIPKAINYILPWVKQLTGRDWNYATMTLYSYLYWAQKRNLLSLNEYPELLHFLERFKDQKEVQETTF